MIREMCFGWTIFSSSMWVNWRKTFHMLIIFCLCEKKCPYNEDAYKFYRLSSSFVCMFVCVCKPVWMCGNGRVTNHLHKDIHGKMCKNYISHMFRRQSELGCIVIYGRIFNSWLTMWRKLYFAKRFKCLLMWMKLR